MYGYNYEKAHVFLGMLASMQKYIILQSTLLYVHYSQISYFSNFNYILKSLENFCINKYNLLILSKIKSYDSVSVV